MCVMRTVHCCGLNYHWVFKFVVKNMVAKQVPNGLKLAENNFLVYLSTFILAKECSSILKDNRDNRIKVKIQGFCAAVQDKKLSSICKKNVTHTYGVATPIFLRLIKKTINVNFLKSIAVPKLSIFSTRCLSYVIPGIIIVVWTRSPVKSENAFKVFRHFKGTNLFIRYLNTDYRSWSSKRVVNELVLIKTNSINNNMNAVNASIDSLLGMPEFWQFCYESIHIDPNCLYCFSDSVRILNKFSTSDTKSLEFFQKLSISISKGSFKFNSTKKKNVFQFQSILQLSEINDFQQDKIVEKGIVTILKFISEHKLLECNFGLRRGHSCHDALAYIFKKVSSEVWAIESDVTKCFDKFNNNRLILLVKDKYTSQQTFIDLLYKALESGIISVSKLFKHKTLSQQESSLNAILFNIYMHELDKYVTENLINDKFKKNKVTSQGSELTAFMKFSQFEKVQGEVIRKLSGKYKMWKYFHKLDIFKLKFAKMNNIIVSNFNKSNNFKLIYVRYANNFIFFICGFKCDCLELKLLVKNFLKTDLNLHLTNKKIKTTDLKKDKAEFIGFQLWQFSDKLLYSKANINPIGKIDRLKTNSKYRKIVTQASKLRITFSMEKVLRKLLKKGLVKLKNGRFFPTSYKLVLKYEVKNIIKYLKAVFKGIVNYYNIAHNWYDAKSLYNYFGRFCAAMTIAHKTKTKVPEVFKKYGKELTILNSHNQIVATYGFLANRPFRN